MGGERSCPGPGSLVVPAPGIPWQVLVSPWLRVWLGRMRMRACEDHHVWGQRPPLLQTGSHVPGAGSVAENCFSLEPPHLCQAAAALWFQNVPDEFSSGPPGSPRTGLRLLSLWVFPRPLSSSWSQLFLGLVLNFFFLFWRGRVTERREGERDTESSHLLGHFSDAPSEQG